MQRRMAPIPVSSRVLQRADWWIAGGLSCMGIMAKQQQNSEILTKSIDCLELMREQMLTLQRALERVESDKRGQQSQRPTTSLKIKQF
jgi:hypothetical protein